MDILYRISWELVQNTIFRYSPRQFHIYRVAILKLFGANLMWNTYIYPTVKIWKPSNLVIGSLSCLGDDVYVYNVGRVIIGRSTTISQRSILCTAGHDYTTESFDLITKNIIIKNHVWVAMNVFISPGVTIEDNCVILPCACVTSQTVVNSVYAGVPAKRIKQRFFNGK